MQRRIIKSLLRWVMKTRFGYRKNLKFSKSLSNRSLIKKNRKRQLRKLIKK